MGWKRKRLEALDDEDLNDVCLVGTDGKEVACSKFMLATQSPLFKTMFYRGFREQRADRCRLDFHSTVIELVVKYCYSGELNVSPNISKYRYSHPQKLAALLVELREAGRYFELEELRLDAERLIGVYVFEKCNAENACAFLNELFKRGEVEGPIWSALFEFAAKHPYDCFGNSRDSCQPHAFLLVKVLEKITDTFTVVSCLQAWFVRKSVKVRSTSNEEEQALVEFSKRVDLKELSTDQLSVLFRKRPCILFPSERILEAVFHHSRFQAIHQVPRSRFIVVTKYFVSGAGREYLNGFYSQLCYTADKKKNIFYKKGRFRERDCLFIIHYNSVKMKWLLSITRSKNLVEYDARGDFDEAYIQCHVYHAEDCESVPFNSWNCRERTSTGPAPIVARIDG